jgi:hypothetical protein
MIDASSFANLHNSFWTAHAPSLERFVRRLNLELTQRWSPPINKPPEKIRAALVSETAFSRFCNLVSSPNLEKIDEISLVEAKKKLIPLMGEDQDLIAPLSLSEKDQIKEIEKNLITFFRQRGEQVIIRPLINGCGYVDASEADVISGVSLFEIKAVDRPFKGTDIKQLMTYCALNHASKQFYIEDIAIFNPRQGIWFQLNLDNIAREISGQSAQELCERVALTLCSGDLSR